MNDTIEAMMSMWRLYLSIGWQIVDSIRGERAEFNLDFSKWIWGKPRPEEKKGPGIYRVKKLPSRILPSPGPCLHNYPIRDDVFYLGFSNSPRFRKILVFRHLSHASTTTLSGMTYPTLTTFLDFVWSLRFATKAMPLQPLCQKRRILSCQCRESWRTLIGLRSRVDS